jgi:hypothetical protein
VYVPDAVPTGRGDDHLVPLSTMRQPKTFELVPVAGAGIPAARGTVWVRSLGRVDGVDVSVSGLAPRSTYTLYLADGGTTSGRAWPLATVVTDGNGGAPLVEAVTPSGLPPLDTGAAGRRPMLFLVRGATADAQVVLATH